MERVRLGNTGLLVSKLGVGTDVINTYSGRGPSAAEYAPVLRRALDLGVNFWDTSDDYGTHTHIKLALSGVDRAKVVLATKTWARETNAAVQSLQRSLSELGTDYVDIFLLHAVTPREVSEALATIRGLEVVKADGLVRALGLTTHCVSVVNRVAEEPDVDVVYFTFNPLAHNIEDGSVEDMAEAAGRCFAAGKGTCSMKALAKGKLTHDLASALRFSLNFPYAHSVLVGIESVSELEADVAIARSEEPRKGLSFHP